MKKKERTLFDDPFAPNLGAHMPDDYDPFKILKSDKKVKTPRAKKPKPERLPLLPATPKYAPGLLAIDIANCTGYCTVKGSGVWNFTPKKDESKGMRLVKFKAALIKACTVEPINIIVFEQIAIYGDYPNTVAMEMVGVLKLFCEENGINFKGYPVKTIKMQTGHGNAGKDVMVGFAQRYKPGVTSDDEADAIVLYQLAVHDLNL